MMLPCVTFHTVQRYFVGFDDHGGHKRAPVAVELPGNDRVVPDLAVDKLFPGPGRLDSGKL